MSPLLNSDSTPLTVEQIIAAQRRLSERNPEQDRAAAEFYREYHRRLAAAWPPCGSSGSGRRRASHERSHAQ